MSGPGRPPVGPKTTVRIEPELRDALNKYGLEHRLALAQVIRLACQRLIGDTERNPT